MASKFKIYFVRPVRDFCIYHFIHGILTIGTLFPRVIVTSWYGLLAKIGYLFAGKLKSDIKANLKLAYNNNLTDNEIDVISQNLFINLTKTLVDYALWWKKNTKEQFLEYFTVEGEEHLSHAFNKGRGVICLIPHTVGWEFSAIMPPLLGYASFGVSSRLHNNGLHKLMVNLRESRGMRNVTREHCFDKLVEGLKNGECLIIMIDQDSQHIKGEFLTFFGKSAYTPIGVARLAIATGAAIVPMFTVRKTNGNYLFKILPEVPFARSGDDQNDISVNTQKHNDVIEAIVREYPDQWLWFHNRWRTTPESLQLYLDWKKANKAKK